VVHLDGLDLAFLVGRHEADLHALLHDARLDAADRDSPDAADAVHVLDGQAKRLVNGLFRLLEEVQCLENRRAGVPGGFRALLGNVRPCKRTGRDEEDLGRLVPDHLQQ